MKTKIITFLKERNIEIPNNDNEIINLFLGALVVGKIDHWLGYAFDFIDNGKPQIPFEREWSDAAKQDKAYRDSLATLNEETKNQIKKLLRESVEGAVFSILSELDRDDWSIDLDGGDLCGTANENGDLSVDLYNWIELFGNKILNR